MPGKWNGWQCNWAGEIGWQSFSSPKTVWNVTVTSIMRHLRKFPSGRRIWINANFHIHKTWRLHLSSWIPLPFITLTPTWGFCGTDFRSPRRPCGLLVVLTRGHRQRLQENRSQWGHPWARNYHNLKSALRYTVGGVASGSHGFHSFLLRLSNYFRFSTQSLIVILHFSFVYCQVNATRLVKWNDASLLQALNVL